jgi:glycosyltransferase involved in cell wall biosynthesis
MPPRAECLVLASTLALGGGERVLAKLLRELSARGRKFHLITLKNPGSVGEQLRSEGVDTDAWNFKRTRDPRILFRLWKEMRRRAPGIIYIQDHNDCIFWGSLAAALSGFIPVMIPVHSSGQRGATSFRFFNRLLLGLGQVLVLLGAWHHRTLREEDGLVEGPRATIPNPLDSRRFTYSSGQRSGDLVLGTVAALRPEKRHELLIELFATAARKRSILLRIVGDGPERKKLERRAVELSVEDRVEFVGAREDIPQQLARMDLFLLTSEVEAQPLSLIEALACGVSVAAPARGGIPEILEEGQRGLILEGEDSFAWGRQVEKYLDHLPSDKEAQVTAEAIQQEFSDERFARDYERLFDILAGEL